MGKKARKTRWRTLTIADEHSDSEESNTTSTTRLPKGYQPKPYYNKFPYSSQSTPRRRYQHDCTKSTRSSSTASENKITFNEDEYTRITTPRQDVLFKKGYLNKPKNYQTQTSTGTSTTSTGNSTGNGTPDHQSTDLEYESQFVFPNGFVDQNGIYYVNGYESYPLMLYNPPTYYPEYSNCRSKTYSTDSLTESMSPNNEEATSQDLSGGEASNNVSDYSGHHQVYNMVYPGYYVNGVCPPNGEANEQNPTDQIRKIKKRRRRKSTGSKSQSAQDSSECTEDESDSGDEGNSPNSMTNCFPNTEDIAKTLVPENYIEKHEENRLENETTQSNVSDKKPEEIERETVKPEEEKSLSPIPNGIQENDKELKEENSTESQHAITEDAKSATTEETANNTTSDAPKAQKYDLKPDAEEFIPRAYRNSEIPVNPNLQYIKVPPNFVPIPLVPLDFNGQNFNPAFIPPGIPINFLPPDPKLFPNVIGFVQNPSFAPKTDAEVEENQATNSESINNPTEIVKCDNFNTAKEENLHQHQKPVEKTYVQSINGKTIDIATIVSKLEEAAKEQENYDAKKNSNDDARKSPRRKFYENKYFRSNQKYNNYKRNHYGSAQNSPQRSSPNFKSDNKSQHMVLNTEPALSSAICSPEHKLEGKDENPNNSQREMSPYKTQVSGQEDHRGKNSPTTFKKNWKQSNQNGTTKWQQNGIYKNAINKNYRSRQNYNNTNIENKEKSTYKKFSEMVKNKTPQSEEQNKHENFDSKEVRIETIPTPKNNVTPQKEFNQWISVSNKKKRKNKTIEENDVSFNDHFEEEKVEESSQVDVFESYDVNLLVDVVPATQPEETTSENKEENSIENIIHNIAENIPTNNTENELTINMRSLSEIENELIIKTDQTEDENDAIQNEIVSTEEIIIVETSVEEPPQLEPIRNHEEVVKSQNKKKSKKGTPKPITKRVIITDIDLSMNCQEVKPTIKSQTTTAENIKIVNEKCEECVPPAPVKVDEEEIKETVTKSSEEEEKKKGKKKKKKSPKPNIATGSLSSSNTTLNVDDSYDFLLDSALSEESTEKTNIEVSQELDKIIQKGMYSSLEEKIKLLNIDESDGFFKSIFSKISSRESSVEKTAFTKAPDLNKILQNTTPLFKTSSVSQENNSQNKDINKILPDLDSPDEDGVFLENPDQHDIPQDQNVTNDIKDEDKKVEDSHTNCDTAKAPKLEIDVEQKTLYPITQAVKDWMCRTRETTPDVEILKSPSTIYKEFFDSVSEIETEVNDSKTLSSSDDLSIAFGDEEITIFNKNTESKKKSTQQDLMKYWENDLETSNSITHSEDDRTQEDCQHKDIEQGEDVVEMYESKYGKNEDFLRIQREVKEKTNNPNYSRYGNLPYRAICCDIM